jgi:GH24 family phage-related lysozyme (muramidase)
MAMAGLAEEAFAKVKKNEGVALKAYSDPKKDVKTGQDKEKHWSIGYGHQITQQEIDQGFIQIGNEKIPVINGNEKLGEKTVITKEQAEILAKKDFEKYITAAKKITNFDKLSKEAQIALIDMTFNMGEYWFSPKKWPNLHKALTNLDMDSAADQILDSDYHKDPRTKKRAEENAEMIRKSKVFISNNSAALPANQVANLFTETGGSGNSLNDSSVENAEMKKMMGRNDTSVNINSPTTIINKQNPKQSISKPTEADKPAIAGIQ